MSNEEKAKRLKFVQFGLFGAFTIVLAATTTMTYLVIAPLMGPMAAFTMPAYWISIILTAAMCVGAYFGYRWWINRG